MYRYLILGLGIFAGSAAFAGTLKSTDGETLVIDGVAHEQPSQNCTSNRPSSQSYDDCIYGEANADMQSLQKGIRGSRDKLSQDGSNQEQQLDPLYQVQKDVSASRQKLGINPR